MQKGRLLLVSVLSAMVAVLMLATNGFAQQSLSISKSGDFSTDDRAFSRKDTLYIAVTSPDIDFTNLNDSDYKLQPHSDHQELKGHLTNHSDGTYTAKIPLSKTTPGHSFWELEVEISDHAGNEFRARVAITITRDGNPPAAGTGKPIEAKGFIDEIQGNQIVVHGLAFLANDQTGISGKDHRTLTLADLKVGLKVEVKAISQNDGSLLAIRIKIEDDDGATEVELKGFVEEITDTTITIAGKTFFVDSSAKIIDRDKLPVLLSQLQVGAFVEAKGESRADGLLWAVRIKVKNAPGVEVELKGIIEALSQTEITVNGISFTLDSETIFLGHSHQPSDISALQVGQFVEVKAHRQPDGSLRAVRIELEDEAENELELTGAIEAITGNSITLFNVVFLTDINTEILDHSKNPITLADLQIGMVVEAKGRLDVNGNVTAIRIKIEDHANDEIEIKANIEAVRTGGLTVAGIEFSVNGKTLILNRDKQSIAFTDLQAGQFVEIKARRQPDGTLLAVRIKLKDQGKMHIEIRGSITAISGDTLVVEGVAFKTNANTQFLGHDESILTLSDFNIGDFVKAESETFVDGLPLLKKVKKEKFVAIRGQIQSVSNSQFTILAANIVFDTNTLIAGLFNRSTDASAIVEGAQVLVRGSVAGSGEVLASSVIITSSTTTGVNTPDAGILPADFVLEQNYPNPFNPRTTLRYRIRSATPQRVSLRIYNLLGQEVRILVDAIKPAGVYATTWDGRDNGGRQMASGIYLSHLQVGGMTQVKRMVLSK